MIGLVADRDAAAKVAKHAAAKVAKHAVVKVAKHAAVKVAKHAVAKVVKVAKHAGVAVVVIRDAEVDREMVAEDVVHGVVIKNQSRIVSWGRKNPNPSAMQCRRVKNLCVRLVI